MEYHMSILIYLYGSTLCNSDILGVSALAPIPSILRLNGNCQTLFIPKLSGFGFKAINLKRFLTPKCINGFLQGQDCRLVNRVCEEAIHLYRFTVFGNTFPENFRFSSISGSNLCYSRRVFASLKYLGQGQMIYWTGKKLSSKAVSLQQNKGPWGWKNQKRQRIEVDGGGRRQRCSFGKHHYLGIPA